MRRRFFWWAVLTLVFLVHLWGLYTPGSEGGSTLPPGSDKVAHFGIFLGMALPLLALGFRARLVLPVMAGYGVVSELLQYFLVPRRSGDPLDWCADLVGLVAALVLVRWVAPRERRGAAEPETPTEPPAR